MSLVVVEMYYPFVLMQPNTGDPGFTTGGNTSIGNVVAAYQNSPHTGVNNLVFDQSGAYIITDESTNKAFYIINESKILYKYAP